MAAFAFLLFSYNFILQSCISKENFQVLGVIADENLLDAADDLARGIVGLDEIIGGAEPLGLFHVVFLAEIGKNNHRCLPYLLVGANLLERFKPVYAGQNEIQEYQMRLFAFGLLQCVLAVQRFQYIEAFFP